MDNRPVNTKFSDAVKLVVSPRLIAICLAGCFMLIVGAVLSITYLFLMAGTILSMPLIGYLVAMVSLKQLSLTRSAPLMVQEHDQFEVALTIQNNSLLPRYGLRVIDRIPPSLERLTDQAEILGVSSQESYKESYRVRALRRGVALLNESDVVCEDMLGIFQVHSVLRDLTELLIYPVAVDFDVRAILYSHSNDGTGHILMRPYDSTEIHGVREYAPGDELRRIHWPTSARTGDLVVVELEDKPQQWSIVVVDARIGTPELSLDAATRVARGTCESLLANNSSFALLAGSEFCIVESHEQLTDLYAGLARVRPQRNDGLCQKIESISPYSGVPVIIVTGNFSTELVKDVELLINRGYGVSVLFVYDPSCTNQPSESELNAVSRVGAQVAVVPTSKAKEAPQEAKK